MTNALRKPTTARRRFQKRACGWLGLLLWIAAGCAGSSRSPGTTGERPRGLERADAAFLAGDYETAVNEYQLLLAKHEAGTWAAAAGCRLGLAYLERNSPSAAMSAFRQAEAARPDPAVEAQIWVGEGNAALALGDFTTAAERFRKALAEHGDRVRRERVERSLAQAESRTSVTPSAPAAAAAATGYTVQVGAFSDSAGASAKVREVERAGFRCEVRPTPKYGHTLYVVCVGRYDTWADANAAARGLRAKGISAIVSP